MSTQLAPTQDPVPTFDQALIEAADALRVATPEHAVVICDELINHYPDAVRALRMRAHALEAMGDNDQACKDYERVLDISPTDAECTLSYARALSRVGRKEEAALVAQQVLETHPNDHEMQQIAGGATVLRAGEEHPATGRLAAARAQFAAGRVSLAMKTLNRLIAQDPERVDARLTMVEFLWRTGKRIAAAEMCQSILNTQPDCLAAHALLAQVWHGTGALQQMHLRAVVQLDPDHREISALLPGQNYFAITDASAEASTKTGFDAGDFDDSDSLDHDAYIADLVAASGPIVPTQTAPVVAGGFVDEGEIANFAELKWDDATGADDDDAGDDDEEKLSDADWLKQLQAKSRPPAEGEPLDLDHEPDEAQPADILVLDDDDDEDESDVDLIEDAVEANEESPVENPSSPIVEKGNDDANELEELEWLTPDELATLPTPLPVVTAKPARVFVGTPSSPNKPKSPQGFLMAARTALSEKDFDGALQAYERALKSSKWVDDVLSDAMQVVAKHPLPQWYLLLGKAYTAKGKIDAALEAYNKASGLLK